MRKIRVLIVDDSAVVRRIVTEVLSSDPTIEVVGTAANGRIALSKVSQLNPDLVTLDVEMPEMNGIEALAEIRKTHQKLPVIMFSSLTERGASATLDALALGANDYVLKPFQINNPAVAIQSIRDEIIPKIKVFCHWAGDLGSPATHSQRPKVKLAEKLLAPLDELQRVDFLAIGVSTGGPAALATLLPMFPADFPVPMAIVQHMPAIFTKLLAERLSAHSAIKVCEGDSGRTIELAQSWIAPGDHHMVVVKHEETTLIRTYKGPPENFCRPSVDVLFRSVAEVYGPNALAVILTGMGRDGLRGCQSIREAGGRVLVQDEASSVVWGMPRCVAEAGLADQVLPLHDLGSEVLRRVRIGRKTSEAKSAGVETFSVGGEINP